jgi:UDP-N-acetyl-D-galactosamine dehydrogenase
MNTTQNLKIAIIGLGYVGLPLAIEFAKKFDVLGFDINSQRINELNDSIDKTLEASKEDLMFVTEHKKEHGNVGLRFSCEVDDLKEYNFYVVTVPTPIDQFKSPDLTPLLKASEMLGRVMSKDDIVVYESTVYPGCTEEECVPVLESISGLIFNKEFYVGYSPERINPGDKVNTLTKIKKVTSGSTPEIAKVVDDVYKSIITAGTYKASSIKVAEASKAIENAQRDLNISFVNELALIFDRIGIDTNDVIDAASTKWNFLRYKPGLVGGHCIGVDPYYLAHKAQSLGYHPQVILSGRRVNDNMGSFVANKVIKLMINKDNKIKDANVLVLGITFKENCPDVRNTRVVDIYSELLNFGVKVDIYDPWANKQEVLDEYAVEISNELVENKIYDAVVVAVSHDEFLDIDYKSLTHENAVIFDTKAFLNREIVDGRL